MSPKSLSAKLIGRIRALPVGAAAAHAAGQGLTVAMTPLLRMPPAWLRSATPDHPDGTSSGRPSWQLPVVLVMLLGEAPAEVVEDTVDRLRRLAVHPAGVRPVLVLDGAELQIARRAGVPVDHVVSRRHWAARHGEPYQRYLARRLTGLRRDYAARQLVTVPATGWADDDDALRVLRAARHDASPGRLQAGMVRLERALDPA